VRENPRPTRHLEHVEPGRIGKPLPGSIGGPAWDLVPLPDPPDYGEPTSSGDVEGGISAMSGDADGSDPATPSGKGSRKRLAMAAGGAAFVVLVVGIGGLAVLGKDRPEDADAETGVERAALELPFMTPDAPASDRPAGPKQRAEARPGRADPAEAVDDAVVGRPGDATTKSGTQTGQAGQGGTTGSGAGTGTEGGTGSGTAPDPGIGTGSGGGTTTPSAAPPSPTSDPTTTPTSTPEPTPSPSEEPTPDPTPSPTVSPSQEPTGTPVPPGAGQ
jgi:hypothetical protein